VVDHSGPPRACATVAGKLTDPTEGVPEDAVDQKRPDVLAVLEAMTVHFRSDPAPMHVSYAFQHTSMWERGRQEVTGLSKETDTPANFDSGVG
jgi:hypothetical protein